MLKRSLYRGNVRWTFLTGTSASETGASASTARPATIVKPDGSWSWKDKDELAHVV